LEESIAKGFGIVLLILHCDNTNRICSGVKEFLIMYCMGNVNKKIVE